MAGRSVTAEASKREVIEIPAAGHFWIEDGVLDQLIQEVQGWLTRTRGRGGGGGKRRRSGEAGRESAGEASGQESMEEQEDQGGVVILS